MYHSVMLYWACAVGFSVVSLGYIWDSLGTGDLTDMTRCFYVGMSDEDEEGTWTWLDGSTVTDVTWGYRPWFVRLTKGWYRDCGKICKGERRGIFAWYPIMCTEWYYFMCQYVSLGYIWDSLGTGDLTDMTRCFYVGMSDEDEEGTWTWLDGSTVTDVTWGYRPWFVRLTKGWYRDCGKICKGERRGIFAWYPIMCTEWYYFMCQYEKRKRKSTRKTRPTKRAHVEVVKKIADSCYLGGNPILETRVPIVTMCVRMCQGRCVYLNYNSRTKQCRGFQDLETDCKSKHMTAQVVPWGVWQLTLGVR